MSIEASIERVHLLNKETLIVSDINIDFREKLGYGKHRLAKGLRNLHSKQLKKLEAYGIVNTELKWCRSYLNGRKQVVHLSGKESSKVPMEHGIPQGSILGPLFFILFINYLPLHVSSQVDLYAEDNLNLNFH